MGTSFTGYRGYGFWTRDARLELWLRALVRQIDKSNSTQQWLKDARGYWHLQSAGYFNGCISPNLDKIVTSNIRCRLVQLISEQAHNDLMAQEPNLSWAYLKSIDCLENFGPPLPKAAFIAVSEKWVKLFNPACAEESGDAWDRIQKLPPE